MPNTDPEKRKAYQRAYIKRTAECHRLHSKEAMRRWRASSPAARLARDRAYKRRHPDQVRAGDKRYREKHPERRRTISQRRRARELGATGNFTLVEWTALLDEYENRCGYCGASGPLQADHRVPLSRGGTHDIENIMPACRQCNLEKATMSEFEFRRRLAVESKKHRKLDDKAAG